MLEILVSLTLSTPKQVASAMAKGKSSLSNFRHHSHSFSFVEFETQADLKTAVEKLDGQTFKGATVHCIADVSVLPWDFIHSF